MRLFGQYLTDNGHVTTRQLLECLIEQSNLMHSVPKICFDHNLLTEEQIITILKDQAYSKKDFITIASDQGIWSEDLQNRIEVESKKSRPLIGELLISKGILDKTKISTILTEYYTECEKEKTSCLNILTQKVDKELQNPDADFLSLREILGLALLAGKKDFALSLDAYIRKNEKSETSNVLTSERNEVLNKFSTNLDLNTAAAA